jgi:superfamily II DNA or RNA helicase
VQTHLQSPLDDYQLVVVDEAHNYRNPDTPTRAAVLRRLLFGRPRDVLLLTATPVNNSLWDLFHLIRFFARQDAFLADRGVLSIYDRFQ